MKSNSIKSLSSATAALVIASLMLVQPAHAAPINVAGGEMNFGAVGGSVQADAIGVMAGLGFTHRYDDVIGGVDAIATVIAIENLDPDDQVLNGSQNLMDAFDDSSSTGKEIDVDIDIFGDSSTTQPATGFVTFRIDFVAANTNNAAVLQNIGIVVDDIDSNQYVQFAGISAYELSVTPTTELTVTANGGAYEFKEPIGASSDSQDEENWVAVEYAEASSITLTLGAREYGGASFGVSFVDATWTQAPNRVTPALTAYDLSYDDNGATSGSVPSAQTSTVNSATVTLAAPQGNLIRTNCTFGGWNTREDGQGANFLNTESITMTADTTLYANWTCEETNLLPGGSIRNSDGLIGLVGKPFFDEGQQGNWSYDAGEIDEVTTGATADCEDTWTSWALLCDPAPTTNQRGAITQFDADVGYTSSMDDQNSVSFIVVDLGQVSTFSSLEVYQMWNSDGLVTHVEMFVSSMTDIWPIQSLPSWTSVAGGIGEDAGLVELGAIQTGTSPLLLTNEAVTVFNFSEVSGRYVMFYFANDGRYENDQSGTDGYIEVAGVKLFGSVGNTGSTPTPTLANTGADVELLLVGSLTSIVAGAGFFALSRRKRTA